MSNLEDLIKEAKKKHAAELKEIREKAARDEEFLLARVARLFEEKNPEQFKQYRDYAARLIEQEREQEQQQRELQRAARAKRAKDARARRKEQPEAVHDGGGETQ